MINENTKSLEIVLYLSKNVREFFSLKIKTIKRIEKESDPKTVNLSEYLHVVLHLNLL